MNPAAAFASMGLGFLAVLLWRWARAEPSAPDQAFLVPGFAGVDELFTFTGFEPEPEPPAGRVIVGPLQMAQPPDPTAEPEPLLAMFSSARPAAGWQLPDQARAYAADIASAEARYGIPAGLLGRVLYQESRFRPDVIDGRTTSSAGAIGIAQFMPATAQDMGVDPRDPHQAIPGAARYLAQLRAQFGDWKTALAAYNWGPGNVSRSGTGAAPAETRAYVSEITADVPV